MKATIKASSKNEEVIIRLEDSTTIHIKGDSIATWKRGPTRSYFFSGSKRNPITAKEIAEALESAVAP